MRVLALDIGKVRVGVAVCDPGERVASPVCVLPTKDVLANAASFRRVLEDWEPELLLCGLPYTLAGQEGPQAVRIRSAHKRGVRRSLRIRRRAPQFSRSQTEFA